ncbi:MAG: GAF domain-containing protein [Fusobacteriaceae bacterium]|nr:GAF domain-containing protein [Fusobacteriaceae bacterium]
MKIERYEFLLKYLESSFEGERNFIANLANASAVINENLENLNWAGFYLYDREDLVLGPFQGKPACVRIKLGKGVCGTAAANKETLIVENVHEFPGHIACDVASNSEIVVPIYIGDRLIGVLDLDSFEYNNFDEVDKKYLEKAVEIIIEASDIK